jgi:two-component system, NarL family, sensor kinase
VMIFQIVKELLQNVIKHSGAHGANIRILDGDQSIRTIVADDGDGFQARDAKIAGNFEGGLGLFSIRERVKSFSGTIQVKSRPGIGSEVTVELPKTKASKPASSKSPGRRRRE